MAITFVGSKTFTHAEVSAQSCSLTDLLDTAGASVSPAAGDLVLINYVISTANVDRTNAEMTPSGYTEVVNTNLYQNDANDANQLVSYKFMPASPDTTVSIPASNATTAGVSCTIHCFRGVNTATPLDVTPTTAGAINTGIANAPTITPITAGAWIVACGAAGVAAGAVFTNPAGMSGTTNHFRSATITSTTTDANSGTALKTDWTSGAYDTAVFGGSTSTNTGSWTATTVVLRPTIDATLTPSLFTDGDTFFTPTVATTYDLTPSLFTDGDTFYAPTVANIQALTPDLFTNSANFPSATVAPGSVDLTPALYAESDTFPSATVAAGAVDLAPDLFVNAAGFYSATVSPGAVDLTPALYADGDAFYTPTVASAGQALTPSLYTDADTFYTPTVADVGQLLTPALFTAAAAFYGVTIQQLTDISPSPLVGENLFYIITTSSWQPERPEASTWTDEPAPSPAAWSASAPASSAWGETTPSAATWPPHPPPSDATWN